MKLNLLSTFLLTAITLIFCQCSKAEFDNFPEEEGMENLPESSKQLGLAVANELNVTIRNLHKQGVDYSTANQTANFNETFYNDFFKASPSAIKTKSSASTIGMSPEEFARRVQSLTQIQLDFIDRIITECSTSTSEVDYYNRLIAINNDIYTMVPEIQQERLFNVTSVLYYSMKEIQKLERQGLMIATPRSNMQQVLVKTRSESGGGSFGETCRSFLATSMIVAIATPIPGDEVIVGAVITAVATGYAVYTAGTWLYEYIVCKRKETDTSNNDHCLNKYEQCIQFGPLGNGRDYWKCDGIYKYCLQQGIWDINRF